MGIFDDFVREEVPRLEPGDYRVEITDVEEAVSKSSGNPMLVITVKPNNANIRIKHYIVKNEYFNRNMTEFYDSFNIDFDDRNFLGWVGAVGAAKLVENEDGYMKIKRLIPLERQDKLPDWVGPVPVRQTMESFVSDDELPF